MFTEGHLARAALAGPTRKIICGTCIKDFRETIYQKRLQCQTLIKYFKRQNVHWGMCKLSNVELRGAIWDKHVGSKRC